MTHPTKTPATNDPANKQSVDLVAALDNILALAETMIYREEGAHTSRHWLELLELHSITEYLLDSVEHRADAEQVNTFLHDAQQELQFWCDPE